MAGGLGSGLSGAGHIQLCARHGTGDRAGHAGAGGRRHPGNGRSRPGWQGHTQGHKAHFRAWVGRLSVVPLGVV